MSGNEKRTYVREKDKDGRWVDTYFDTYEEASEYVDKKYCPWDWEQKQKRQRELDKRIATSPLRDVPLKE